MTTFSGSASGFLDLLSRIDESLSQAHASLATHLPGRVHLTGIDGAPGGYRGGPLTTTETFTLVAQGANSFSVTGSHAGLIGEAQIDKPFLHPRVQFLLAGQGLPPTAGDTLTLHTTNPWRRLSTAGTPGPSARAGPAWSTLPAMFDDNNYSKASSRSLPAEIVFSCPWPQVIRYVGIQCAPWAAPAAWTLAWADNPQGPWTEAAGFSGLVTETWTPYTNRTRPFTLSDTGLHRYWRWRVTGATQGAQVTLTRLSLRASAADRTGLETDAQVTWSAPGFDGAQQIPITVSTATDSSTDTWNLLLSAAPEHEPGLPATQQQGGSPQVVLPLHNNPMPYWICINGQRLVIAVQVGPSWICAYAGFCRSYASGAVAPWPCVVGAASASRTKRHADVDDDLRAFFAGTPQHIWSCYPDRRWRTHGNRTNNASGSAPSDSAGRMWPDNWADNDYRNTVVRNIDGSWPLLPIVLLSPFHQHAVGELDGVFWTTGFANAAGNSIQHAGHTHLVVQSANRASASEMAAIRLD